MNNMYTEKRNVKTLLIATTLLFAILLSACNVNVNVKDIQKQDQDQDRDRLEQLYKLNRDSLANMKVEEGPIYVIGHKSPDSDTVCSAVAYARLLTMLGYTANAAVTLYPFWTAKTYKVTYNTNYSAEWRTAYDNLSTFGGDARRGVDADHIVADNLEISHSGTARELYLGNPIEA